MVKRKAGMRLNILVIDIGTTSTRGILYDERGSELAMHSVSTPLITDADTGYMEQSPDTYRACITEIAKAIAEAGAVDAVSVTAYRSAPTLVDKEGRALTNFIMWQDTRNSGICQRLAPESDLIYRRSGERLNTVFTASKLTWFRENMPEVWRRAWKAMIVPDYVIHLMTGIAWGHYQDYLYGKWDGREHWDEAQTDRLDRKSVV